MWLLFFIVEAVGSYPVCPVLNCPALIYATSFNDLTSHRKGT